MSFTNGVNLHTHHLDLLDEDGRSYIGLRPLQSSKLIIPTKEIMIVVFWEKSFKSKEADHSKRFASPLLASRKGNFPSP